MAKKSKISKTVQQSIPYVAVYQNGIIELKKGRFSKSYYFGDADFKSQEEESQDNMMLEYQNLLNRFGADHVIQISIFNRTTDMDKIKDEFFIKPKNDEVQHYREEYNQILEEKIMEGRNDIKRERYLTIALSAKDIVAADLAFRQIDTDVDENMKKINKAGARPLTITERLHILYDLYNSDEKLNFLDKISAMTVDGELDLKKMKAHGFSSKDLIGCSSITTRKINMLQLGDVYCKSFVLHNLPTVLNTDIIIEMSGLPCNMITSVSNQTTSQKKAVRMIKNQITNIGSDTIKLQRTAAEKGYSAELLSPDIAYAKEEADNLLSSVMGQNQKIFYVTVTFTLFASSEEELFTYTEMLKSKAADFLCQVKSLDAQQLAGFNTSLPIGCLDLEDVDRVLPTEAAGVFFPFSMNEIMGAGGLYYGANAISNNMIVYNRATSALPSGVIVGKAGSGKSFIAKTEMMQVFLGTEDDIIVIDPDREYSKLAEGLGGQIIKIASGTETFINPLDMDLAYADKEDPVAMKCDFLVSLCETIIGKEIGLSPFEITLIHRCGKKIYTPYIKHLEDAGLSCDREAVPTLRDFYEELMNQPEHYAKNLALALEQYCTGSYDTFAYRTNVNLESRFIVYDTKDTGSATKDLAYQVCLNDIWNRVIENKRKGKTTWIYLDEFYLLLQTESSAIFLQEIFKRIRKWGGVITGITQDIEDLLISPEARAVINNCGFLLMMNQSPLGREELKGLYHISPNLLSYITDKPPGTGLLYNGTSIAPFRNVYPKETSLYQIFNTKAKEDEE